MHKLKKARLLKGLTQWDIAIKTGIPTTKISLVERGYIPLEKLRESQKDAYLRLLNHKK